jgi:hypothetical protein
MEHVEKRGITTRARTRRSGQERRRQSLPFPPEDELRQGPDRRKDARAEGEGGEFSRNFAQASLLRFLRRY